MDSLRPIDRLRVSGGAIEIGRLVDAFGRTAVREMFREHDEVITRNGLAIMRGTRDVERLITRQRTAVVTCVTAAAQWGLPLTERHDTRIHLAVPRSRSTLRGGPPTSGIVVHRESTPIGTVPHLPWLANVPTLLNRMILCCDEVQAVAALDNALNRRLVTLDELRAPLTGPGARKARRALERCRRGARSILESIARLQLEDAGLSVEVGVEIEGVGEVDMIVGGILVVECDGSSHGAPDQWRKDRERDLRLLEKGYIVIRFTYEQVMTGRVVPAVTWALDRHRHSKPPQRQRFTYRVDSWAQEEALAFQAEMRTLDYSEADVRW